MVLAVARRVTGAHHAAEDVFQAAFLTLARRARQLRRPAGLPGWLHQTAYHLALTAVRARDRRERAEAVTPTLSGGDPFADLSARELLGVLDEELSRLPDRLRQPLVLCGLEGRSQDEAAALLGWTAGAVRGRLERGRRRLKERLARRGLTFGVAVAAMLLLNRPAAVARPLRQVALATALGPAGPPPTVTALLEAGLRSASAVRHGAFALVLAGLVGVGAATLSSREQPKPNSAPPATRPETFLLPAGAGGRLGWDPLRVGYASAVLTPDGKKLVAITAGAVLHMFDATGKPLDRRPLGDRRALHPSIGDVSLSGDGSVATFSENSSTGARLTACETATGRQLLRLGYAPAHALSADGRALAVVEYVPDKGAEMLRVYDLGTGKPRDLAPSGQGLYRLRFTPDGRRLLAFTDPNSEKLACLDTADGKQLWSVRSSGPDHAATTDGQTVFVNGPSGKGPILALDAATGRPAEGFKLPTLRAAAAPAPAGDRLLLVPLWSGEVVVWDYRDGEEVRRLQANRPGPDSFTQAFAPASDGRTAVTTGDGLRRAPGGRPRRLAAGLGPRDREAALRAGGRPGPCRGGSGAGVPPRRRGGRLRRLRVRAGAVALGRRPDGVRPPAIGRAGSLGHPGRGADRGGGLVSADRRGRGRQAGRGGDLPGRPGAAGAGDVLAVRAPRRRPDRRDVLPPQGQGARRGDRLPREQDALAGGSAAAGPVCLLPGVLAVRPVAGDQRAAVRRRLRPATLHPVGGWGAGPVETRLGGVLARRPTFRRGTQAREGGRGAGRVRRLGGGVRWAGRHTVGEARGPGRPGAGQPHAGPPDWLGHPPDRPDDRERGGRVRGAGSQLYHLHDERGSHAGVRARRAVARHRAPRREPHALESARAGRGEVGPRGTRGRLGRAGRGRRREGPAGRRPPRPDPGRGGVCRREVQGPDGPRGRRCSRADRGPGQPPVRGPRAGDRPAPRGRPEGRTGFA